MPEISIIVPVYNVEKYLEKCVQSILNQTFIDYELILVNDGSSDNSGILCDKLAKTDSRIIVIHKANGGLSSARNEGIDIASGHYVGFIDSDDYISPNMYELLYTNLVYENADISMCGLYDCYYGKEPETKEEYYAVVDAEEAIKVVLEAKITSVSAVNKLYKRELFNVLRYPEGRQAEDAFLIVELLECCHKIVITSEQKYYYIHRGCSITTSTFGKKDFDIIYAYEKNYNIIKNKFPRLEPIGRMRLCWAHFWVLDKLLISSHDKKQEKSIVGFLKSNSIFILKNNLFTCSRKVSLLALLLNTRLYSIFLKANNKKNKSLYE